MNQKYNRSQLSDRPLVLTSNESTNPDSASTRIVSEQRPKRSARFWLLLILGCSTLGIFLTVVAFLLFPISPAGFSFLTPDETQPMTIPPELDEEHILMSESDTTYVPSPNLLTPLSQIERHSFTSETQAFSEEGFSIQHPTSWNILTYDTSNFPIKERVLIESPRDKAFALTKNDTYLIIVIEDSAENDLVMTFSSDEVFLDFLKSRTELIIDGERFFYMNEHLSFDQYINDHGGLWMWGSLSEFIPLADAYYYTMFAGERTSIIKNNKSYRFIVTSPAGGMPSPEIDQELKAMLSSIKWSSN